MGLQAGPNLGFHQHADRWLPVLQKAAHGARAVIRQPGLCVTRQQQFAPGLAAGGRAVGQQQAQVWPGLAQGGDQGRGGAGFAQ